jgi:hypothetical protein
MIRPARREDRMDDVIGLIPERDKLRGSAQAPGGLQFRVADVRWKGLFDA